MVLFVHPITWRATTVPAFLETIQVREAALASLAMVGKGISDFLRTPSSVFSLVAAVAGVAFAVYSIRELMRIASTEVRTYARTHVRATR